MVRVGESRQSFPLPGKPSLEPCLRLPDGAERSLTGTHKQPAMGSQVQVWAYPPPPSCFRLGGSLARVLVLVIYAQNPEPGLELNAEVVNRLPAKGRIGTLHNGEEWA